MASQLTIRGVSEALHERLSALSRSRGQSINATVLEILEAVAGVEEQRRSLTRNSTWGHAELADFERALAGQRTNEDPRPGVTREELLDRACELLATEEAEADVERYLAIQAETLLGE